jgi:hypothetical protein
MADEIKECPPFIGFPVDGIIFIYKVEDVPSGFFKIGNLIRIRDCVYRVEGVSVTRHYKSLFSDCFFLAVKILPIVLE